MPEFGFYGVPGTHRIPVQYASVVFPDAPRAYYRLDEPSGTTMIDRGGTLGNGTYSSGTTLNQPSLLARDANKAASFAGSSGATIPSCVFAGDFTWECWAQWAPGHLNENDAFFGASGFIVALFSGKLALYNGGWISIGGTAPAAGVPYHVAYVRSGSTLTVYLNGVVDGTYSYGTASITFDRVGTAFSDNRTFDGVLDEVAFYTTALSAARIAAHAQAGK